MLKVAIGQPRGDMVYSLTADCKEMLILRSRREVELIGFPRVSSSPDDNQNAVFAAALDAGCDAVFLMDSDMIFPAHSLLTLLAHDLPVVGAVYRSRISPHHLLVDVDGETLECPTKGIVPVRHIPSGLMLIQRAVLEGMPYPWMEKKYGRRPADLIGHDVNFCRKANVKGFSVYADMDLSAEVYHIGAIPVGL